MKHGLAGRGLSRTSSHRMLMLRNLVSSLIEHGQIKTTIAKAKETARLAEKMITLGKKWSLGNESARQSAEAFLLKPTITLPLLHDIYAPRFAERPGGYTRIHKFGNRPGDNAPHAIIELVDGPRDLKFELTARTVGRETVEKYLEHGQFVESSEASSSNSPSAAKKALREYTQINMAKALRYRSQEDKERFQQKATEWANRIIAEPQLHGGLRQVREFSDDADKTTTTGAASTTAPKKYIKFVGRRQNAGERLPGAPPSKSSSTINIARGQLGRYPTRKSKLWEPGWKGSLASGSVNNAPQEI